MILIDFEVLFGRPRGLPGAPFSDLAHPEAARAENKIQSTYTVRDVSAYPYRGSLRYITKDDVIHPCRG